MKKKKYLSILSHYESCLEKYGDTHLGVDWPKKQDVDTRYRVMLEVIKMDTPGKVHLLDFGCGASHLYEYLLQRKRHNINYSGLDLSEKFIGLSRSKFPSNNYYCLDILEDSVSLPDFDYVVMNGVFTEKLDLSFDEMFTFFQGVVRKVFNKSRVGIAFNVMSKQVDWEREDLFHLPLDLLAAFLTKEVSRHFVIRHDYGLYEYTTYVYRQPGPDDMTG
jgi:SAM-dependent methyltransferase